MFLRNPDKMWISFLCENDEKLPVDRDDTIKVTKI